MQKLIFVFALICASVGHATNVIQVTEPAFTAEKIEFNPITNSYGEILESCGLRS